MILDNVIATITNEVEKRIIKQLEELTFTIDVKVSRGEEDNEDEDV